jgi:lipoprotein-releasing system permease protein
MATTDTPGYRLRATSSCLDSALPAQPRQLEPACRFAVAFGQRRRDGNDQVHGACGGSRERSTSIGRVHIPYEWQVGWRYVRAARGHGFLSFIAGVSVLGIALGVAALVVVLSVVNGFEREVRDRMLDAAGHIELYHAEPALAARVRAQPGVVAVAPFVTAMLLVGRGDALRGAQLRGVLPNSEPAVTPLLTAPLLAPLRAGERRILLGRTLARELGAKPGDAVTLVLPGAGAPRWQRFTLAGTVDAGHHEFDSTLAIAQLEEALEAVSPAAPRGLRVRVADPQDARAIAARLESQLGPGVQVRDWTQLNRPWFESVHIQKRMLFLIVVLIVAVAAFNLVATLVMTVADKRGDIAILRTLGASPRSVMAIFVVQGALAGLAGTLAGVLLGLAAAFNIGAIVSGIETLLGSPLLRADIYLITRMPSEPRPVEVALIAAISAALAFAATLYPSWRASRLQPAEALRYE